MRRIVLDTSVLVAAVRSDQGASRVLLVVALEREYELLLSVPLMLEYESVLTRAEHLEVSGDEMQTILDAIALVAEPVRLAYLWRPVLRDANDDMVLETAVNGRADLLVTLDRIGLDAASSFDLSVVTPAEEAVGLLRRSR